MARRSGLGKGLSSLIPPTDSFSEKSDPSIEGTIFREIPLGDITPNPYQPRRQFDEEALAELTASVQQIGVLQPVLVRTTETGFELVAGERRWRAAGRAGLSVIPAIIRTVDDAASVEQALVENLHRQDLNVLEEAAAYQQLIDDFDMTHEVVADRVGKSRSAITNTLRLLGLPPKIQQLLADNKISAGHARALLGTPDRSRQEQLADQAVAEGWTVRALEEATKGKIPNINFAPVAEPVNQEPTRDGAGISPGTRLRPPGLLELEELLAEHLATRVSVQMSAKKGRIQIDFADLEDLERIYRCMTGE